MQRTQKRVKQPTCIHRNTPPPRGQAALLLAHECSDPPLMHAGWGGGLGLLGAAGLLTYGAGQSLDKPCSMAYDPLTTTPSDWGLQHTPLSAEEGMGGCMGTKPPTRTTPGRGTPRAAVPGTKENSK